MERKEIVELHNKIVNDWMKPHLVDDSVFEQYFMFGKNLKVFDEFDIGLLRATRTMLVGMFNHPMYYNPSDVFELEGMCKSRGEDSFLFDEWDEYITKLSDCIEKYCNVIDKKRVS